MDEIRTSTRKLYPSRPAADDGYRHKPLALGVVGREFSSLQIRKNFPTDVLGIGERFETERVPPQWSFPKNPVFAPAARTR